MEPKICRLRGVIKTIRLHNLLNDSTNLSDPGLRRLGHTCNSFQTCWKLSESKTFKNYFCIHQLLFEYKYKYIMSKKKGVKNIERSKMSELSNFQK